LCALPWGWHEPAANGAGEAVYLSDPDDSLALVNLPLDVDALLSAA
jgi:hypothetical protein